MAEPESYEEARASELRRYAFLCGEFRDALILAKIPTDLANGLVADWFTEELAMEDIGVDDD